MARTSPYSFPDAPCGHAVVSVVGPDKSAVAECEQGCKWWLRKFKFRIRKPHTFVFGGRVNGDNK